MIRAVLAFDAAVAQHLQGRDGAIEMLLAAYEQQDEEAPGCLAGARTLGRLAGILFSAGDEEGYEEASTLAFAMAEAAGPDGPTWASLLSLVATSRARVGDLAGAEQAMRRSVEWHRTHLPETQSAVIAYVNLGARLRARGDLDAADRCWRHGLSMAERTPGTDRTRAVLIHNLGELLRDKGDLARAEDLLREAAAQFGELARGSMAHMLAMGLVGDTLRRRGDLPAARALLEQAVAMVEQTAPEGNLAGSVYLGAGDLARAEGDWEQAEEFYGRAAELYERLKNDPLERSQAWNGLATALRARGDHDRALALSARAVALVDDQRNRLLGSDQARALFASRFFGIYHDHVQWLVERGQVAEAFGVLERSRARSLLALIAERDLLLDDDLPPALERKRRAVDAEYERTLDALADARTRPEQVEGLKLSLDDLRQEQERVAEAVRRSSPRLADLRSPDALDAREVASHLGAGTLLLSYSVGREKTIVFSLAPASGADPAPILRAVVVDVGEDALRRRIDAWRAGAERAVPPPGFRREARALYDLLLAPLEAEIRSARRLLISPDGPLHGLPFAALRGREGYLIERLPVQTAISGTLHAQLVRTRRTPKRSPRLVGFGDPRYEPGGLPALPASRREVETIARLFRGSVAHLGTAATEERAKNLGPDADYVHFALHGLVDEHSPLDSSLALATPHRGGDGIENGRLHTWEIFESVRLNAELVTLSACRSALGKEHAGEGVIGLVRAFQFAGARTVLASLWDVGDRGTAQFMARFYGSLKRGASKDEALRRAQIAAIRAGQHPVRWAAFKAYGDWR